MKRVTEVLIGVSLLVVSTSVLAQALSVRGGFTGNWTDPIANRQGIQIEIIDPRRAVVAWFTYDMFGAPTWLFGVGEVRGAAIEVEMLRFSNGTFPPGDAEPDAVMSQVWGDVVITFTGCNNGQMSWQPDLPEFDPGSMAIERISAIDGLRCGQAEEFEQSVTFSLDAGPGHWEGIFADFGENTQPEDTDAEWSTVPEPLSDRMGFKLAGTNRSDDLAMLLFTPLGGLMPETDYRLEFDLTFATDVPRNCFGAGGAPGDSVFVKVGASGIEPSVVEEPERFSFNIDKGNQSRGGDDAIVIGDMANSQDCEEVNANGDWELKTVTSRGRDFFATTDGEGRLWTYAISDSGFEGRTRFFVTDFTVRLRRNNEDIQSADQSRR